MHNKLTTTFLAFAALALPTIAMADVSNNVTLNSGQHYSFDTGTTSTSGGDIDFTGTSITFARQRTTFFSSRRYWRHRDTTVWRSSEITSSSTLSLFDLRRSVSDLRTFARRNRPLRS